MESAKGGVTESQARTPISTCCLLAETARKKKLIKHISKQSVQSRLRLRTTYLVTNIPTYVFLFSSNILTRSKQCVKKETTISYIAVFSFVLVSDNSDTEPCSKTCLIRRAIKNGKMCHTDPESNQSPQF